MTAKKNTGYNILTLFKNLNSKGVSKKAPFFSIGSCYSIGKQRRQNEDAYLTLTSKFRSEDRITRFGLFIVADGMGGHQHGELASDLAIRIFSARILPHIFTAGNEVSSSLPSETTHRFLEESVRMAHEEIQKVAPESGTTLTAALIIDNLMTITHAGDCRAYIFDSDRKIHQLTRDHSMVNKLLELGKITPDQAELHPQRNVLYNALGQVEIVHADIFDHKLAYPTTLLLCSDGLWGVVPETTITKIIHSASDPQDACDKLINAANKYGGPDNITSVIVHLTA